MRGGKKIEEREEKGAQGRGVDEGIYLKKREGKREFREKRGRETNMVEVKG